MGTTLKREIGVCPVCQNEPVKQVSADKQWIEFVCQRCNMLLERTRVPGTTPTPAPVEIEPEPAPPESVPAVNQISGDQVVTLAVQELVDILTQAYVDGRQAAIRDLQVPLDILTIQKHVIASYVSNLQTQVRKGVIDGSNSTGSSSSGAGHTGSPAADSPGAQSKKTGVGTKQSGKRA